MDMSNQNETLKNVNTYSDDETADIGANIKKLREDLANLASSLQKAGADKTEEYRDSLAGLFTSMADTSKAFASNSRRGATEFEESSARKVADHPFQALAIAAGAGLLVAMATQRVGR